MRRLKWMRKKPNLTLKLYLYTRGETIDLQLYARKPFCPFTLHRS